VPSACHVASSAAANALVANSIRDPAIPVAKLTGIDLLSTVMGGRI
jgi:hypothetical protein